MRLVISVLLFLIFSTSSYATELTIGLIPEQNVFKQFERYKPLGDYIEHKTGIKINFMILSRYGNIIDSFNKKKLDGAFWGSFTGAMAIKKLDIEPIVRPVNLDGTSTYNGYIFVRKDSGIKDTTDMKGKTIVFVERATTAGFIFPVAYFKREGIKNIDNYFKEYYFAGSHDATIHAVLGGKADIGCAKNTIFNLLASKDKRVTKDLIILAESPHVPSNGLGIRRSLAYGVKEELRHALLEMNRDPEGKAVLKKFGAFRFIETRERDYAPVFDIAEKAGINLKDYEYLNR
jgi:phosphonate transport system substrate-binding protein